MKKVILIVGVLVFLGRCNPPTQRQAKNANIETAVEQICDVRQSEKSEIEIDAQKEESIIKKDIESSVFVVERDTINSRTPLTVRAIQMYLFLRSRQNDREIRRQHRDAVSQEGNNVGR